MACSSKPHATFLRHDAGLVWPARAGVAAGTDSVQAGTAVNLFIRKGMCLQCRQDADSSPGSLKERIQSEGRWGGEDLRPVFRGTLTVGSRDSWDEALSVWGY